MPANSRWDLIQRLNNLNDPDRPQCVKLTSQLLLVPKIRMNETVRLTSVPLYGFMAWIWKNSLLLSSSSLSGPSQAMARFIVHLEYGPPDQVSAGRLCHGILKRGYTVGNMIKLYDYESSASSSGQWSSSLRNFITMKEVFGVTVPGASCAMVNWTWWGYI